MALPSPTTTDEAARERARLARQRQVLAGLLVTFGGLFLLLGTLPVGTDPLLHDLPVLVAAVLALWVGGILMGFAMGRRVKAPG